MKKKLLVLDLDETLIYSSETALDYQEDFSFKKYYVYKRPGLETFLNIINQYFEFCLFAGSCDDGL